MAMVLNPASEMTNDLFLPRDLIEAGKIKSVIDRL